eukprot:7409469-Alexandrium_andersonii.AAC.1
MPWPRCTSGPSTHQGIPRPTDALREQQQSEQHTGLGRCPRGSRASGPPHFGEGSNRAQQSM